MSKPDTEERITEEDLSKSVQNLTAMLNADAPVKDGDATATLEKSLEAGLVGTNGGLTPEVAAPELDPSLTTQPAETDDGLNIGGDVAKSETSDPSEVEGLELRAEMGLESASPADDAFVKSIAAAFAEQEVIHEITQANEFAKSLVISTIEGLSIANDEMRKSFAELETRQNAHIDQRINVLAKSLIAITKAVGEIHKEVMAVANAPVRRVAKGAGALEKSFSAESGHEELSKARVMPVLERLQGEGKIDAFQLVRYESTGEISPALAAMVQSELGK